MHLSCFRCQTSFSLKKEEIAFAIEALRESGDAHYDARCPRGHANRLSLEQLERAAPRTESPSEE